MPARLPPLTRGCCGTNPRQPTRSSEHLAASAAAHRGLRFVPKMQTATMHTHTTIGRQHMCKHCASLQAVRLMCVARGVRQVRLPPTQPRRYENLRGLDHSGGLLFFLGAGEGSIRYRPSVTLPGAVHAWRIGLAHACPLSTADARLCGTVRASPRVLPSSWRHLPPHIGVCSVFGKMQTASMHAHRTIERQHM